MRAYRHPYRRPSRLRRPNTFAAPHPILPPVNVTVTCRAGDPDPIPAAAPGFLAGITGLIGALVGRRSPKRKGHE